MSKANVKTTRMTCKYTNEAVAYNHEEQQNGEWVVVGTRVFELAELAAKVYEDGDSKVSLAAYGLRALLADRTSQLRELGPKAVLEGMDGYYDLLKAGAWKATRKAAGRARVDMVLVEVVAKLKKCPLAAAEELVRKAPAETIEALKAKYAKEYDAIAKKAADAEGADLDDLIG
jgi:molybdopterin converting factor small subunit